jgi:hypothetical protein
VDKEGDYSRFGQSISQQAIIVLDRAGCYNLVALGNSLAVGRMALDHEGQVRILVPQPLVILLPYLAKREVRLN